MQCTIFHKNEVENIYILNESKTHGTFIFYNLLSEIHAHFRYDFTSMNLFRNIAISINLFRNIAISIMIVTYTL